MGTIQILRLRFALVVASLVCGGCASGGGGGVSTPVSPPPPPPSPPVFLNPALTIPPAPSGIDPTEYAADYGVGATGAAAAWSRGFTGAGIKIGVIDDGVEDASQMSATAYQEIVGRVDPASKDIVQVDPVSGNVVSSGGVARNQLSTSLSHGTELTSLIAGNANGSLTVGMAYGATVLAVRADNGAESFNDHDLANAVNYAVSQGVKVINFSLGSASQSSSEFKAALTAATAAGVIIVNSAGNDGPTASEVNYPGFYATDPTVSHNLIISAGGIDSTGVFYTQSNPAGQAANFYLTAPGWQIIVPDYGPTGPVIINGLRYQYCGSESNLPPDLAGLPPGLCQIQGTSYASPHVTGAIALLLQAFPGMTPQQIVQLVLTSTDDQAAPGVDSLTGHGRLDLIKAFQPVGTVAAPVSGLGGEIALGQTIGVVGAAFGDAFVHRADWSSVGFDAFGRTFAVNLAPSWLRASRPGLAQNGPPLLWRQSRQAGGLSTSFALSEDPPQAAGVIGETPRAAFRTQLELAPGRQFAFASGVSALAEPNDAPTAGHLAFAGYEQSAAFTQALGDGARVSLLAQGGSTQLGAALGASDKRAGAVRIESVLGAATFAATLGAISEDGGVLGASWDQRFGAAPRASTRFVALTAGRRFSRLWDLSLQGEVGSTRIADSGWLTLPGALTTTAGAASLRWSIMPIALRRAFPDLGGAMTFSISQPLRVEAGAFSAMLPTANEYGRQSLAFSSRPISAEPTGREIDASVDYSLWTQARFAARFSAAYRKDPGHDATAAPEQLVSVTLRYGF
jgi:Subtilase family